MVRFGFCLAIFMASLNPGDSRVISDPFSSIWDITQKSSTPDICSDCGQIIELFTDTLSNKHTQDPSNTLTALCTRLPPGRGSYCTSQARKYLPKVLRYLVPVEACTVLGLCAVRSERELVQTAKEMLHAVHTVRAETDVSSAPSNAQMEITPQCTLCLLAIKKLEDMLPKNKTEETVLKLLGDVCALLPGAYKDQCTDFVLKYGKDVVVFLLSTAAPHTICSMLHLCLVGEELGGDLLLPSDCDSCRTLAVLSRLHLGLNSTESHTASFLQSVCHHHPTAVHKCETFTRLHGSRLQKVLGSQIKGPDACERADLCAAVKRPHAMGADQCTWGPSYWCQDKATAQKCGNVAYCEEFMWAE